MPGPSPRLRGFGPAGGSSPDMTSVWTFRRLDLRRPTLQCEAAASPILEPHDLYIVAIRCLRRDCVRALLSACAENLSGWAARGREPVLLRLWTARAIALAGCRRARHLSVPRACAREQAAVAAGRDRKSVV